MAAPLGRWGAICFRHQCHSLSVTAKEVDVPGDIVDHPFLSLSWGKNEPLNVAGQNLPCLCRLGIESRPEVERLLAHKVADGFEGER